HTRSYGDWSSDVCSSDLAARWSSAEESTVIKSSWCVLPRRRRARATTLAAHEPLLYAHPESTRVRASFYTAKGPAREVLQVGELPTPSPAPGEVRVRVAFS